MLFSRNRGKAPLFPPSLNETQLKKWEETGPLYEEVERSSRNGGARYRRVKNGSYQLLNSDSNGEATILCVGDILCEDRMYQTHRISSRGGGFEFDSVYSLVRPVIAECDLAIANLETNVCEKSPYTGEQYKVEGKYHNNAPVEFLDAIKNAGFDFLMLANNHSLDSGVNGAMETLRRIDERGMMRTGLFSPDESLRGVVVEVNGISVGLLSYSTWYNRNESRLTEIGRRQIINMYDVNRVREDIETIRSRGAEFVLVYMHWGVDAEYKQVPSKSMKEQAKEVANAGADYIIGSHTHSVQPYATITTDDQRSVPCFFSMGNFVTSERASIARNSILLKLKLKRGAKGKVEVARESIIPCHVPDRLLNLHYPVVPDVEGIGNAPSMEECRSSFSSTSKIVDYENGKLGSTYQLTKAKLCEILDLPKPEVDEEYASLRFAKDSVKGCASIVCDITSDPSHVTPRTRFEGLAKEAMDKGAKLLISSEQIKDYPCLLVEDPFAAYCKVIAEIRRFFSPRTICITGSIGKTSTTEMVRAVIRSKCSQTHFNTGSANSVRYSGTVIQGLKAGHKFYVQELMEGPPYGAASTISKLVQPQASIVTVVGSSHLEYFGGFGSLCDKGLA